MMMPPPPPNYDYAFLQRKRIAAENNTPLMPKWTCLKLLKPNEYLNITFTDQEAMNLFNAPLNVGFNQRIVVDVVDFDDGTLHKVSIIRVADTCHAFSQVDWIQKFVNRRSLVPGHVIGFCFEPESATLFFSVIRIPSHQVNWKFKKSLAKSDLQQLAIMNGEVRELFGSHMPPDIANLGMGEGRAFDVLDFDKGTMRRITLGRVAEFWHAFCVEWVTDFVYPRLLVRHDVVGFYWDHRKNRLVFSVLVKHEAAREQYIEVLDD